MQKIITPTENTYTLELPDEFIGKRLKVSVEITEDKMSTGKTIEELKAELSGLTTSLEGFKFDRNEANDYD
ncbi:MAG: hypothetical protein HC913_05820 [Microscillaceae bacterium]|nr:hypothetical protein [Microscillaceae bacterium]